MIIGARQGTLSSVRRLLAASMARDLGAFLVPGPEIARAHGLDIAAAGIQVLGSPRHASVLLVIGKISPALREAATVIYAQMMRPRTIFAIGTEDLSPLPPADVIAGLSQHDLLEGVRQLRSLFAQGAFHPDVSDFEAPALQSRIRYTCPMHAEVIQDKPGTCPKCGMTLIPSEAQDTTNHAHGGMDHSQMDHAHKDHEHMNHAGMDHSQMDHADMTFMSMVEVTRDLPRSTDGLPMEWVEVPFGPFFPGLPGGLLLTLTLDGNTVAGSTARSMIENTDLFQFLSADTTDLIGQLAGMDPLAPVAYQLLACHAVENAAGIEVSADTAHACIGALERERIASHLGWLALFGQQTGLGWLPRRAASLQLRVQHADLQQIMALRPELAALVKWMQRTPLLKSRTAGIGELAHDVVLRGPVARAAGIKDDVRSTEKAYTSLGFSPAGHKGGDVFSRLQVRLDEIGHSLTLIEAAGAIELPALAPVGDLSGQGEATVETARGMARLQLTLDKGQVVATSLETPSTHHLKLIGPLTEQQELGDALVAVGSLDLSPWEIRQ